MLNFFHIVILLFFFIKLHAQKEDNKLFIGQFHADITRINKSYDSENLNSILKSKNKIEIRLFIRHSWEGKSCIIMKFNAIWEKLFYKYDYKEKKYVLESVARNEDLDETFQKLVTKNIFALSTDSNKGKTSYFNLDTNKIEPQNRYITDGVRYYLEFKVGDNFNAYYFENPESYAAFDPFNHKLKDFSDIVKILSSGFNY